MLIPIPDFSQQIFAEFGRSKVFDGLASDLSKIKEQIVGLEEIVVRGSFILDTLLDLNPNDIDLFYSFFNDNGGYTRECRCDLIRQEIQKLELSIIPNHSFDLENSFEKEPGLPPVERTVSIFTYHTDYLSCICFDDQGRIWCHPTSFKCLMTRVFEIRYEGFVPWGFFPRDTDRQSFYSFYTDVIIRGLAYVKKRDLKVGSQFLELLHMLPFLVERAESCNDFEKVRAFARKKLGGMDQISEVVRGLGVENEEEVIVGLERL